MRLHRQFAAAILGGALLGCSSPMTKIAPQPVGDVEMTGDTAGSACGVNLFGVIPINVNSRAERAYRQALDRGHATGLTNTTVTDRWYWIYVGQMVCTDISGTGFVKSGS